MLWKASTWRNDRLETISNVAVFKLSLLILARVLTGLLIAAAIVIGLTRPSGAQMTNHVSAESTYMKDHNERLVPSYEAH